MFIVQRIKGGVRGNPLVEITSSLRYVYYKISSVKTEGVQEEEACPGEGVLNIRCPWARVNPQLRGQGLQIKEESFISREKIYQQPKDEKGNPAFDSDGEPIMEEVKDENGKPKYEEKTIHYRRFIRDGHNSSENNERYENP